MSKNNAKFSYTALAAVFGIITALTGFFILIGWQFDTTALKTFGFNSVSMKPNSALAFLLAGLSLLLLNLKNKNKTSEAVSKALSAVVLVIGSLTTIEYLIHIDFGIDQILFKDMQNAVLTIIPGRMSFNLALGYVFTGITLLLVRKENIFLNIIVLFSAAIGTIAIFGYVFNLPFLLQLVGINTIALNSAICLIILSAGIYITLPNRELERTKIELQTIVVFVVVAFFIITTSIISLIIQKKITELDKQIVHATYVSEKIEHIFTLVKDRETGLRGYVITGDEVYLEPLNSSQSEIHRQIYALKPITTDSTENQYLCTLISLIEKRISFDEETISIRKAAELQTAIERITGRTGKLLIDSIGVIVKKMKSSEFKIYNDQSELELNIAKEAKLIQTIIIFIQFGFLIAIYFLISHAIIKRKKVEVGLKSIESSMRMFYLGVEQSPTSVIITDIEGNIEYVNPYFSEATGYSSKEVIGNNPRILNSGNKTSQEFKVLWDTILSGKSWRGDLLNKKKNGELFWESTTISPIKNQTGETTHFIAMKLDITEIKKANRIYTVLSNINHTIVRVQDNQTLYNEVCRIAVEDGNFKMAWIGIVDPQTNKVNPVASAGFTDNYLININIDLNDEKISQGPTGWAIKTGMHYLANDISNNPEMIPWREKALGLGYKSSASFPIKVYGKSIGAFMLYSGDTFFFDETEVKLLDGLAMDISFAIEVNENEIKRKRAEQVLIVANKELVFQNEQKEKRAVELLVAKEKAEEMSRLKSNFLANMSHELRTPLIGINGFSDVLRQGIENPELKEMAEIIFNSGSRLSETLNLILDLSKFESGDMGFIYQKIDIVIETEEIISLLKVTAHKKGLYLKSIYNQPTIFINTDTRAFHSILNNLINNAIKYTKEGGVSVDISLKDNFVEIKVIDSGIGIAREYHETIFDEFRQVSEGYSRSFEGTGLGLNITMKLVNKFGGEITVESELGKGSTFVVKLPVTSEVKKQWKIQ
jgi:PAS domain S-box-containing protein